MTREGAETAVVTSALAMSGIYFYRRLTEPIGEKEKRKQPSPKETAEGVIGLGDQLPIGAWMTGIGVSFMVISILASISPNVGGYSAVLLATTSFLGNANDFFHDLRTSSNSSLQKQAKGEKSGTKGVAETEEYTTTRGKVQLA